MKRLLIPLLLCACPRPDVDPPASGGAGSDLSVKTSSDATVYVAFGSDSAVTADDWSFCTGSGLTCSFSLNGTKDLPLNGAYINATFSFNAAVGCGVTKAEVNVNNPKWYDTMDVSLVDGYSNDVKITVTEPGDRLSTVLGPPKGATGNEDVYGLFPVGCDLCVQRGAPPCGIAPGPEHGDGCKLHGTQYDPVPPCQYQGKTKGGGDATILVELVD